MAVTLDQPLASQPGAYRSSASVPSLDQVCRDLALRVCQLENEREGMHHQLRESAATVAHLQSHWKNNQARAELLQRRTDLRLESVQVHLDKLSTQIDMANKAVEIVSLQQEGCDSAAAMAERLLDLQQSSQDMLASHREDVHSVEAQLRIQQREVRFLSQQLDAILASRRSSGGLSATPKPHPASSLAAPSHLDTICGSPQSAAAAHRYCRRRWVECRFAVHHCWRKDQGLPHMDPVRCPAHTTVLASRCQRCSSCPSSSSSGAPQALE